MTNPVIRKILGLFLVAGMVSCARPVQPPASIPAVTQDQMLEVLADNAADFKSLKGVARVSFHEQGQKAVKGKQILLVEKPNRVRSEVLGLLGQPLAVVAVDGENTSVLVPRDGVLFQGETSARNLRRVLHIPLKIEDLVSFILYQVPVIKYHSSNIDISPEGGYRLFLEGEKGIREELIFNPELDLVEARFHKGSEEVLKLTYGDFSDGENPFPRRLFLSLPGHGIEARVEFLSISTNVDLDDNLFHLERPKGFKVRPLL